MNANHLASINNQSVGLRLGELMKVLLLGVSIVPAVVFLTLLDPAAFWFLPALSILFFAAALQISNAENWSVLRSWFGLLSTKFGGTDVVAGYDKKAANDRHYKSAA